MPDNSSSNFFKWQEQANMVKKMVQLYSESEYRRTAIVAGAKNGMVAVMLAEKFFDRVICYEPDPDMFESLMENARGVLGLELINAPLGDAEDIKEKLPLKKQLNPANGSRVTYDDPHEFTDNQIDHQCDSIDSSRASFVDFIYLDAAGYEAHILNGACQTIDKYHPVIVINEDKIHRYGTWDEKYMIRKFRKMGYVQQEISKHGTLYLHGE